MQEDCLDCLVIGGGAAGLVAAVYLGRYRRCALVMLAFDVLYPALGLVHHCELATGLGARVRQDGQLEVDAHYQTTVPGLYAAGDVAVDLNQINVAAGQAAIAATAVHNSL